MVRALKNQVEGVTLLELLIALGIVLLIASFLIQGFAGNYAARGVIFSKKDFLEVESHLRSSLFRSLSEAVTKSGSCKKIAQNIEQAKFDNQQSQILRLIPFAPSAVNFLPKAISKRCQARNAADQHTSSRGIYGCLEVRPGSNSSEFLKHHRVVVEFYYAFWNLKLDRAENCQEFLKIQHLLQAGRVYYSIYSISKSQKEKFEKNNLNINSGIIYGQVNPKE